MAAASNVLDNRKLTKDIGFIHAMYQMVKGAAKEACFGNKFCYYPDNITILGGAAYNFHASRLKIDLMETSDIDMTWWPQEVVQKDPQMKDLILPKDITDLSNSLVESIPSESTEWNTLVGRLLEMTVSNIKYIVEDKRFPPESKSRRDDVIVNRTIEVSMIVNDTYQFKKICSVVIRNALNSQDYTLDHSVVEGIELKMENDPTYCDQSNTALIDSSRVPQFMHFIGQQLFSYKNLYFSAHIEKANMQLQRVINMYSRSPVDAIVYEIMKVYGIILKHRPSQAFIQDFMKMTATSGLWNHMQRLFQQMMQQQMYQQQMMQQQMMQPPIQYVAPEQPSNVSVNVLTVKQAKDELRRIIDNNKLICTKFKGDMRNSKNKVYLNYTDNIKLSLNYNDSDFLLYLQKYKEIANGMNENPIVSQEFKGVISQLMTVFNRTIPPQGGSRKKRTIKRKKNKSKTKKRSTR